MRQKHNHTTFDALSPVRSLGLGVRVPEPNLMLAVATASHLDRFTGGPSSSGTQTPNMLRVIMPFKMQRRWAIVTWRNRTWLVQYAPLSVAALETASSPEVD